nr:immunoglobulin heavy chain junction region [Macaca mulatta]MOW46122.1 immunoglobulin heavy chain junction region [Macaca mulatta]MOW46243.1 immunoglobulin heavy chain junction region [Macaca mulatta]MOW46492.1 immunoglobulin heavy chain junction region [Macaca mulatta]MOW46524.1 immunoglobulin heavy chain junction region [Macaca mulatta]
CARASYDQEYESGYFRYNRFDVW